MRWGLALLSGVCAAVVAAGAANAVTPARCGKLLPPASGIYFGVYPGWDFVPGSFDDFPNPVDVKHFEVLTGRRVAWAPWSISWHDRLEFPAAGVHDIWRTGYVPQIRLFTFPTQDYAPGALPENAYPGPITHSDVAAGRYDAQLRAFADAARDTEIPIFFDYDGEMNNAHPWGGRYEGRTATHFRDAYRHIIDVFRAEGATNVTFLIQYGAINGYAPGSYWEPFEQYANYYPGDDYIDWIGLSVYGEPIYGSGPNATFEQRLTAQGITQFGYVGPYAEAAALGSKPLAIEEMGLNKMPSEQAKAQWVQDAAAVLASGRYPRIQAIDWWAQDKGGDYDGYPNTSQTFLTAFKQAFDQPLFDAKAQFSGDCSPLPVRRVTLKKRTLSWTAVPNAASYEVWRGTKKLAVVMTTSVRAPKPGPYRVRAVNLVGVGPFATSR